MFGAIAGGIASALAGGAMSKLFGGGQKAASGGIQGDVLATDNNTVRSEERFSRNAETDLVCRLLLEKKKAIKAKTNTLAQTSMKLGEAMYKQQAESDAAKDAAKDDVVDAEFTEVDDDKNKKSA